MSFLTTISISTLATKLFTENLKLAKNTVLVKDNGANAWKTNMKIFVKSELKVNKFTLTPLAISASKIAQISELAHSSNSPLVIRPFPIGSVQQQ
ncbi:hypothetical protein VNO77_14238 [Canavalia gladiata]|uniref:Uncharacterized protein n=1 Tax=Canavalia gladiata TaxID=3824 RepID=A0AAN9M2H8_CANGL